MKNFDAYVAEQLKEPEFRKEYEALEPEFALIRALIDARNRSGITQKELADRTGINQADISRIERGNANPSLRTIRRLAEGMDMRVKLEFEPVKVKHRAQSGTP